jgi:hypothetical protein
MLMRCSRGAKRVVSCLVNSRDASSKWSSSVTYSIELETARRLELRSTSGRDFVSIDLVSRNAILVTSAARDVSKETGREDTWLFVTKQCKGLYATADEVHDAIAPPEP